VREEGQPPTNEGLNSFFLSDAQLGSWLESRHFLDGDVSYLSPLDSAVTLSHHEDISRLQDGAGECVVPRSAACLPALDRFCDANGDACAAATASGYSSDGKVDARHNLAEWSRENPSR
jgi:hypothetical protein